MPSPKRVELGALWAILAARLDQGLPFVVFRHPGGNVIRAILQESGECHEGSLDDGPAFLMAPFDPTQTPAIRMLPDRILEADWPDTIRGGEPGSLESPAVIDDPETRIAHLHRVEKSIEAIHSGRISKVVMARTIDMEVKNYPLDSFQKLAATYPEAFCYCWAHRATGIWMGASPEVLLDFSAGIGLTVALAGTRPVTGREEPEWDDKEFREQELVSDYIIARARELGLGLKYDKPVSVRAGKLWHLKTRFGFSCSFNQAANFARLLHPTPAVCGLPLAAAQDFIKANEPIERAYYTGFLGESGIEGAGSFKLYVNLRCCHIAGNTARIFVGGGITADSDPGSEWDETQQKSLTMLRVLKN